MEDTDWRPSPCPECGVMREAARYPVCDNKECRDYGRGGPDKVERTMTPKEHKRYVWLRSDGEAKIIDTDIVELWQGPYFDREKDRIYELGNEVEVMITVNVKHKPVYRENASGFRTSFENRD